MGRMRIMILISLIIIRVVGRRWMRMVTTCLRLRVWLFT